MNNITDSKAELKLNLEIHSEVKHLRWSFPLEVAR